MIKYDVKLRNGRNETRNVVVSVNTPTEAIVEAEMTNKGFSAIAVNKLQEYIYAVFMVFSGGTTHVTENVKAVSEEEAARIARGRRRGFSVTGIRLLSEVRY